MGNQISCIWTLPILEMRLPAECNPTSAACPLCSNCDPNTGHCVPEASHRCTIFATAAVLALAILLVITAAACRNRRCACNYYFNRSMSLSSMRGGDNQLRQGLVSRGTFLSLDSAVSCTICFEALINCILMPCAHEIACAKCAQRLTHCPICRQPVDTTLKTARRPEESLSAVPNDQVRMRADIATNDDEFDEPRDGSLAPDAATNSSAPSTAHLRNHICLRCGKNTANCLFLPCSHKVWCVECVKSADLPGQCVACGAAITQSLQTFHKRL